MKQKIVLKVQMNNNKSRTRAMIVAAAAYGMESAALRGADKDQLEVVGDGLDPVALVKSLRKKVGQTVVLSIEDLAAKQRQVDKGIYHPYIYDLDQDHSKAFSAEGWAKHGERLIETAQKGWRLLTQSLDKEKKTGPKVHRTEEDRKFRMQGELGLTETPKIEEWKNTKDVHLIVLKVQMNSYKSRQEAMKLMLAVVGVYSVQLQGAEKDELQVTGEGLDPFELIHLLRKNVGHAELVSTSMGVGAPKQKEEETDKSRIPPERPKERDKKTTVHTKDIPFSPSHSGGIEDQEPLRPRVERDTENALNAENQTHLMSETESQITRMTLESDESYMISSEEGKETEPKVYQPEEGQCLERGGLGLTEPPKIEEWESAEEIHLMDNELAELPENPVCRNLSALYLQENYKLRKIPPSFFYHMPALEVLDLSRTRIKSLPESLFGLISLKELLLNKCELLMRISPRIGELVHLEILDLGGTEIMELPKEIGNLVNLKWLEVSFHMFRGGRFKQSDTVIIPCGIISALCQVEELYIDINPDDERWGLCLEATLNEVCSLTELRALKFYFPRVELLGNFVGNNATMMLSSLTHFTFTVGRHAQRIMTRLPSDVDLELDRSDKCLKYVNGEGIPAELKKVLQRATAFFLDRHTTIVKLSSFGIDNMRQLKCCVIGECNELQVIIDGEKEVHEEDDYGKEIQSQAHSKEMVVLESLEYLYIYRMKNLRSICEGPELMQGKSFALLKFLTLRICPQLTSIFSPVLLHNLDNLEELTMEDCPAITSLVSCQSVKNREGSYFLPSLRKMSLHYLPELVGISSGLSIAPKLENMSIYGCPNLKKLPVDDILSSNCLKMIEGELSWWEALEWSTNRPDYLDDLFVIKDDFA